jgi:hypothetical protein
MSALVVEVCCVDAVDPHPTKERLDIITIKGWSCLVGKGQFAVGSSIVFIPPDSVCPPALIEKYNLTYLKNGGRVGVIKIGKVVSQGLVLPAPQSARIGQDLAQEWGITKYEPPEPPAQLQARFVGPKYIWGMYRRGEWSKNRAWHELTRWGIRVLTRRKGKHPDFDEYTDISNIKHYPNVFQVGDDVIVSEKLHGCLEYKTRITLADGTHRKIGEIVNNKLDVEVLGRNDAGELVPTKVLNWYNNGPTDKWVEIKFKRRACGNQGNSFGVLRCTPNHKIWSNGAWQSAAELKSGDIVYQIMSIQDLTFQQESVLIGKMLGDGSCDKQNSTSSSVHFSHVKSKVDYLNYTLQCLGSIASPTTRNLLSGYGSDIVAARTIRLPAIQKLFNSWYMDKKKIVPANILLNPISLAFWYMDDGSLAHDENQDDRASFAVCGFDLISVERLAQALKQSFGIDAQIYTSHNIGNPNGHNRIRLNAQDAEKLFLIIAPYVCPCMQYKLPERFQNRFISISDKSITNWRKLFVEQQIIEIKQVQPARNNITRYDLETDTHNFFANEILVHNSNARYANLKSYKKFWKPEYIFVYGSHHCQIGAAKAWKGFYSEDVYGKIAEKYDLANKIESGFLVYGEVYGPGVQDLTYNEAGLGFRVFDIKHDGKYVDWNVVEYLCQKWGLETVPVLYKGILKDTNQIGLYTSGPSVLYPKQIREGCVVKMAQETNHPRIGRKILKSISVEYLTRPNGTEWK